MSPRRVVVLGGGMAGLAAAWELSSGDWRSRLDSITVYQRGWRLGGKGASSRGVHGRIEEHGLHVLLGYYDTTFRVLRQAYGELDRARTDPDCPILTWRDAFVPSGDVGLADGHGGSWSHFVTRFSGNDRLPGEPGAEDRPLRPIDVAVRSIQLLIDFHRAAPVPDDGGSIHLSASPRPGRNVGAASELRSLVRGGGLTALAAVLEALNRLAGTSPTMPVDGARSMEAVLGSWRDGVRRVVLAEPGARRTWQLVDLVVTNLVGMAADGLLSGTGYDRIDHLDYREWLASHGAAAETLESPIVRGMYDLVFAYEAGDRSRPRFAAGLGLELAGRMLFDFKGSIFWRMQAGMGEVVFAPLYQALRRRGVRFEFFHRLDALRVSGRTVGAVELTRQAQASAGHYEPLDRVRGLPCWPAAPAGSQLDIDPGDDAESHWWSGSGEQVRLIAGEDFDVAVLAVSLGMVPHVATDLVAVDPAWRRMVDGVATVATRSAQLWLRGDEADLGWDGPSGVTLSGFGDTFDTWAAMSHLLPMEGWPQDDAPRSLAYLCGAMPDVEPAQGEAAVRDALERFLGTESAALWPEAAQGTRFRWDLLWDDQERSGSDRLDAQHVRANLDPSDRYVQSIPGSGRHRIRPDATGFSNLAIAGDWTACGLDAGCLEAATRSGVLAGRAILEGRIGDGAKGAT